MNNPPTLSFTLIMKTPLLLTAVFCGGMFSASAFTVDFTQHIGDSTTYSQPDFIIPGQPGPQIDLVPIVVHVPGYGNVQFQITNQGQTGPTFGQMFEAEVGTEFTNDRPNPIPALGFSDETEVQVTFDGAVPFDIDFDFVGVGLGEDFDIDQIDDQNYVITFSSVAGASDTPQGGLRSISFNADAIPEPSSALLSGIALLGLLRRRR